MRSPQQHHPAFKALGALGVMLLCGGLLAGCTASAGQDASDSDAAPVSQKPVNPGPREQPDVPANAGAKNTNLPEDFPTGFVVPGDSTILDTGKRDTSWYLVLEVRTVADGEAVLQKIAEKSLMELTPGEGSEGENKSYQLSGNGLTAQALILPGTSGFYQLSFDISAV